MKTQLLQALKSAQLILFSLDESGHILAIEGSDRDKMGLSHDMIGKSAFRVRNFPVKRSHFNTAISGKDITVTMAVRNYVYETTLTPIRDRHENIIGCHGFSIDVTNRIQLEQELDEERYRVAMSQRINSLAGLANGLAHEINNPLAIISGFSQQIDHMAQQGKLDESRLSRIAERMIITCDRIHKIITNLQNFSRDAGDDPLESTDIQKVAAEAIELCHGRFTSGDIKLEWAPRDKPVLADCRRVQILQVLFNLLNNAVEAVLSSPHAWVRLQVEELSDTVVINITDSGKGIDPGIRHKILEPFFTTKEVGGGTGLGLSAAKGVMESHGGKLFLDSQCPNTRFVVHLPKAAPQAVAS